MRWALLGVVVLLGCGGSGNGSPSSGSTGSASTGSGMPGSGVMIKATLMSAGASGSALGGYELDCVTFGAMPRSGTGVADGKGSLSFTIDANKPFGCFVLDAGSKPAADVVFTSGSSTSQSVSFGTDADLGTIVVDLKNGQAQANLPTSGALATPSGAPCPQGFWLMQVPTQSCHATFWVGGDLRVSYTTPMGNMQPCSYQSEVSLAGAYSGGVFSFKPGLAHYQGCGGAGVTFTLTPDASCGTGQLAMVQTGCANCDAFKPGSNIGQGTGNVTCTYHPPANPAVLQH